MYQRKLRLFSGKTPVPAGEVDYDTWRRQVRQLDQEEDDTDCLSDSQKKRLVLQSLLRPAADTVFHIQGPCKDFLEVLDTVYGSVVEGHELLLQFYTTYQAEQESCSEYVQRLYLQAVDVVEHKGINMADVPKQLLQQLLRGCRDETLLQKLNLESKVDAPPTFATLLLDIRKEEAKQTQKRLRLNTSAKVATTKVEARQPSEQDSSSNSDLGVLKQLLDRVTSLEAQVQQRGVSSAVPAKHRGPAMPQTANRDMSSTAAAVRKKSSRKSNTDLKGFCYRCGEDGHYVPTCTKPSNPILVQEKLLKSCGSLNSQRFL
jgi:hypothetical protein